jgi:hypothetical protein
MKVEFTSYGTRDFVQRYAETYGWLERPGKPSLLVKLLKIRENSLIFTDETGFEYTALSDRGNWFSFIPVVKGSYLYQDSIVVVQRVPARQWRRGICEDNTSIRTLDHQSLNVNFETLKALFSPIRNTTIETFKETLIGNRVLFNNQFSLYQNRFFVYENFIGTYEPGKVTLNNDLFQQEVADIFNSFNIPVTVV